MLHREDLLLLAQRYLWYVPPEEVVETNLRRLIAAVMELGTFEDSHALLRHVGKDAFVQALTDHPSGAISDKSLTFWHYRLGQSGDPPVRRRREIPE